MIHYIKQGLSVGGFLTFCGKIRSNRTASYDTKKITCIKCMEIPIKEFEEYETVMVSLRKRLNDIKFKKDFKDFVK